VEQWANELRDGDHPDDKLVLERISHGFHLIDSSTSDTLGKFTINNHKSALSNYDIMTSLIQKEINLGHYEVCTEEWRPSMISPLGLVPKQDGGFRLIHDCSLPPGKSVNDHTVSFDKQSYETVDNAVALMSKDCYMAKIDIQSAYRAIAIHPDSYAITGLHWIINGVPTYLFDKRLPFGARPSPTYFHKISQCIKRIMIRNGHTNIVAYQDDFLVLGNSYDECYSSYDALIQLLIKLGFNINMSKLVPPCQKLTFLGFELNSIAMTSLLPSQTRTCKACEQYWQHILKNVGQRKGSYNP